MQSAPVLKSLDIPALTPPQPVDWEHPSTPTEGASYLSLLASLRSFLPSPTYTLTTALPAGAWALQHIPLALCAPHLDLLNLMAYDFAGPWTSQSGHHAQLFRPLGSADPSGAAAVDYVLRAGVPARKILLGIPCYGRSFLGVQGAGEPHTGHGGEEGTFEYNVLPREGALEGVDEGRVAAWCRGGDGGWVSYDNAVTVRAKAGWVRERGLGGLFYWAGTGDKKGEGSLVEAGYGEMHEL